MGNEGKLEVPGIKLFGATISVQNSHTAAVKEEAKAKEDRDRDLEDRAAEMKRPEKMVACPRCKSWETKFCYFNNYNVNQPRHFCKGCQRYWTAGGALRNVPVGAGRRKAKPPPPLPTYCRSGLPADHYDFDGLIDDWHASHAAFRQIFPVGKRRRSDSE